MKFFVLSLLLVLSACASPPPAPPAAKIQTGVIDPPDSALPPVLLGYFSQNAHPASTGYEFVRYDLNGDQRRDALVLIKTPFGHWCNNHGCPLLIMQAHNTGFTFNSRIEPVRAPVTISQRKTQGWSDLIIRSSGRTQRPKDIALQHDGTAYPQDPHQQKEYASFIRHDGLQIFGP